MDFIFLALWGIDIPLTHGTFHISNLFQISLLKKKKTVTACALVVHARNVMSLKQGSDDGEQEGE